MTLMNYAQKIATGVGGKVVEVEKVNGVKMLGVQKDRGNISPIVYVDDDYYGNVDINEAIDKAREILDGDMPDLKQFNFIVEGTYIQAKPLLRARLYNRKTKAEVYISAEEYGFDDLIIIPYLELEDRFSIKVTQLMINNWGVTGAEVLQDAMENSKADMKIMKLGLLSLLMSNKRSINGAISALFCKEILEEMFPEGYVVIPASIHEMIAFPYVGVDFSDYVKEVNATQVAEQERLSDKAYVFK